MGRQSNLTVNHNTKSSQSGAIFGEEELDDKLIQKEMLNETVFKENDNKIVLVWRNIIGVGFLHIGALYGLYLIFTSAKIATTIYAIFLCEILQLSITAGPHRLWSHRSYKAKWPLRLLLTVLHSIACEFTILEWARDHRLHHKYSDTNADPHNSKRGFFYCHIGWAFCRKNSDVLEKGKQIDVSDLFNDPIIRFQYEYRNVVIPFACFVFTPWIAVYFWDETWNNAFFIAGALRWVISINSTLFINSLGHMFGNKPYDRNICPTQNKIVAVLAMGEGWHNYHHTFPWDYKAAEFGHYFDNHTAAFIDFFAWLGWAYDLKTVSPDMIKRRVQRTGDGSHELWGWNDKDISKEDQDGTIITHKKIC